MNPVHRTTFATLLCALAAACVQVACQCLPQGLLP